MDQNTVFIYESATGSVRFSFDSAFWITDYSGLSSVEVAISESRSTRQVGASVASLSVDPKNFTLDGVIFDPITANREKILEVFTPATYGTLTILSGGESWYVDVTPTMTPEFEPGDGVEHFQVQLYASYPYFRTTESYSTQLSGLVALFKFPFYTGGKWWISKVSTDYFKTVENLGNVPIEFEIIFTARADLANPELYHMDTGQKVAIQKSMKSGEKIRISTIYGNRGVVSISNTGEVSNGFKYLTIDSDLSMTLLPGNNLLRMDALNGRENLSVILNAPKGVRSGV